MKTIKILTAVALMSTVSITAMAEDKTWFESMTQSVESWFNKSPDQDIETYLDEVTIAVPPMTGNQAAEIEPAAGDYQETLGEAIENIPGSINDEQSFNTEFSNQSGSVAAFEDNYDVNDMANIMPAAGEAEEVTDESVIVVEQEMSVGAESDMAVAIDEFAEETQTEATQTMDTMVEKIEAKPMKATVTTTVITQDTATVDTTSTTAEFVEDNMPTDAEITEAATTAAKDAVAKKVVESMPATTTEVAVEDLQEAAADAVDEAVKDAIEPAAGEMKVKATTAIKNKMMTE